MYRRSFLLALVAPFALHAELPPSFYRKLQMEAPEALEIEVRKAVPGAAASSGSVVVEAVVTKVTRTATGLKRGSAIRIGYFHQVVDPRAPRVPGPSSIPLLHTGDKCAAFLKRTSYSAYEPAAQGRSFSPLIPE